MRGTGNSTGTKNAVTKISTSPANILPKSRKENEIIEVFEKGFKYKDRIIRHAKVVVNKV